MDFINSVIDGFTASPELVDSGVRASNPTFAVWRYVYDGWVAIANGLGFNSVGVGSWISVVASFVTISIGIVFAWWAIRKVTSVIMGSFRSGRIHF